MPNNDKTKDILNNPVLFVFLILSVVPLFGMWLNIGSGVLSVLFASCGLLCSYLCIKKKELTRNILPLCVVFLLAYLCYNTAIVGAQFWVIAYGLALFFIALHSAGIIETETAFVLGIFVVSVFIHIVPALITDYIEEIDPYYDFKWAEAIFNTRMVPNHDWLTYPLKGGLDRSLMPFGNPVAIAVYGKILTLFGMGLLQSAILISGLMAGVAAVIAYFLLKELMYNRHNAKLAAMFGVIVLILSNGWSTKVHAGDSEADSFGAMIMFAVLYVFMYAVNRNNYKVSLLGGSFLLGWLTTVWDGYKLLTMFVCIAIAIISIVGAIKKFRTGKYLMHYLGMFLISNILWRIVLHPPTEIISLIPFKGIEMAGFILAFFAVGINEYIINYRSKISKWAELGVILICGAVFILVYPIAWINFYNVAIVDAGQSGVIFKTIAEQAPFASTIKDYLTGVSRLFGIAGLMSLCAIPILIYFICRENDFGSAVMLSWLCPMVWGLYFKSQYNFIASMPYALASAWVVLFVMTKKEREDGLKILPTIMVIYALVAYSPLASVVSNYEPGTIFYNVASYDRIGWESALQYLLNKPANTAVVTWWDYGHWLTAVSHKFVLIDNLQNDHWEIQDVAKFFMKAETEEDAMKILQKYQDVYKSAPYTNLYSDGVNLNYVAIDWTMIGKSGAMRFIATGNLTNQADGEYDSYTICEFVPRYSNINGTMTTGVDGKFMMTKQLVFQCTGNKDGLAGVLLTINNDNSMRTEALDQSGTRIPWNTWINAHDSSLFGVKSLNDVLSISMQYADRLNNVPPAYYNFIYGSGKFKNFMLARLYFSANIESYKTAGLANVNWSAPKYFTKDQSFEEGFVETWNINYPNVAKVQIVNKSIEVFKYGTN